MGTVIAVSRFSPENLAGLSKPIIYCCPHGDLEKMAVSIGIELAKKLANLRPNRRTIQIGKCFRQIIAEFPDGVVVKDIDVMFNPDYKLDILNLLIAEYKKKPFSVVWPGIYIAGKLVYAEEGCQDYKAYDIRDYDVTCIV